MSTSFSVNAILIDAFHTITFLLATAFTMIKNPNEDDVDEITLAIVNSLSE
jgi:hypothetical protein